MEGERYRFLLHHRPDFFGGTVLDGGGVDCTRNDGHWFFMSLVLRLLKWPTRVTQHSNAFGGDAGEFTASRHRSKLISPPMSIEDSLRIAIDAARASGETYLSYTFETPAGAVDFLAKIVLEGDTIVCKDVCIYAAADPPGIKKSTITRPLLSQFRALQKIGQSLGYSGLHIQGTRTARSSSAKPGKIVDIRRRSKK